MKRKKRRTRKRKMRRRKKRRRRKTRRKKRGRRRAPNLMIAPTIPALRMKGLLTRREKRRGLTP